MTRLARPALVRGRPLPLAEAVLALLPANGAVAVQRDLPGFLHHLRSSDLAETLLVVQGEITFHWQGHEVTCQPGDRLLIPAETEHGSVAGPEGCLYVIVAELRPL